MTSWPVTFYPRPLIWTSTHLSQKSMDCLMDYSFDCLGHLTKLDHIWENKTCFIISCSWLKDLSIDEMVGAWCFDCLSGPPWFTGWISFAPVFIFIYCWVLIFDLSPFFQQQLSIIDFALNYPPIRNNLTSASLLSMLIETDYLNYPPIRNNLTSASLLSMHIETDYNFKNLRVLFKRIPFCLELPVYKTKRKTFST